MGFLSSIFDPGRKQREQSAATAERSEFKGGVATGGGGVRGGVSFGQDGQTNLSGSLGDFAPFLQALLGNANAQFGGQAFDQSLRSTDFAGFGDVFKSALGTAQADPFALGQGVADKLRPGLERAQGTLRNTTFSKLFGSGQGAVSAGASPILEGLQQTFGEQNQALDVAGLNIGRSLQGDAFQRLLGSSGNRQSLEQLFMGAQQNQQNLGIQSLSAASGLSQLPLAFQNALMSAGGLRSDSLLGISGQQGQLASQAKSPLLEALTAAGGLMTGVGAMRTP